VNRIAKTIVTISPYTVSLWLPANIAWCAQVTAAPEDNRIIVFKKGTSQGFKTSIPLGGHTALRESTFEGHHTFKVQQGVRLGMCLFIASEVMFFFSFF
jgi:hypothetical protein